MAFMFNTKCCTSILNPGISNNQQNVETKEQLIEKLNGLYDKVSELRGQLNRGINYEDTPSVRTN